MNEYLVEVGPSASETSSSLNAIEGTDESLVADLRKTIGWLEEAIAEYQELEPKVDANASWFVRNGEDHPKYDQYRTVFDDQRTCLHGLLGRMRVLRELGIGEAARMSIPGTKANKSVVDRFISRADWVAAKRFEVAQREGKAF